MTCVTGLISCFHCSGEKSPRHTNKAVSSLPTSLSCSYSRFISFSLLSFLLSLLLCLKYLEFQLILKEKVFNEKDSDKSGIPKSREDVPHDLALRAKPLHTWLCTLQTGLLRDFFQTSRGS